MRRLRRPPRIAPIRRETKEVKIKGNLCLDGEGRSKISTGIKFLDHMLTLLCFHGFFDLELCATGDLGHHTIEDVAIVFGDAFNEAVGDGVGIRRYGFSYVPMDEALARAVVDISGRYGFSIDRGLEKKEAQAKPPRLEGFSLEDAISFLDTFTKRARITIKIDYKGGPDLHHLLEAIFKALGLALDQATQLDPRRKGVPSTKETLDL